MRPLNQAYLDASISFRGTNKKMQYEEITDEDRAADQLPQALSDAIDRYGLTHFKIKL